MKKLCDKQSGVSLMVGQVVSNHLAGVRFSYPALEREQSKKHPLGVFVLPSESDGESLLTPHT